jgi:hypothetical protein
LKSNSVSVRTGLTTSPFSPVETSTNQSIWLNIYVALAALTLCLAVYWKTLSIGFLLDDFYHVDYLHKVLRGDWTDFLEKLHSNWSGDADSMTSYRPLLSVALLAVFALGRETALAFHITNILLLVLCGICIFHLVNAIADFFGGRSSRLMATSAMLLFIAFPLHPESSVTATNGGDPLSSFFYLFSLLSYFTFKSTNRRRDLVVSLISFLCALLTKEIAVTLPAVISIAAFMSARAQSSETAVLPERKGIGKAEYLFWSVLVGYGVVRALALGTVVGGYGGFYLKLFLKQLSAFFDPATIEKIFVPLNEHMQAPPLLVPGLLLLYSVIALRGIYVLIKGKAERRIALFLLSWLVVGVLPTFQIWHIYPNLIGARLFIISSIPFCMLLALFGTADPESGAGSSRIGLPKGLMKSAPLLLCFGWALLFLINLKPYEIVNGEMEGAKHQLKDLAANSPADSKIILLALPQDHFGAPMLGRAEFLRTFIKPPCMDIDLSQKIMSVEQPSPGAHQFILSQVLQKALLTKKGTIIPLIWSKGSGCFVPWKPATGPDQFQADLRAVVRDSVFNDGSEKPHGNTIVFHSPLRTLEAAEAVLQGNFQEDAKARPNCPVKFFWHTRIPAQFNSDSDISYVSVPADIASANQAVFDLGKYPSWTYATQLIDFGLELPGDYDASKLQNLSIVSAQSIKPQLELTSAVQTPTRGTSTDVSVKHLSEGSRVVLAYRIREIEGVSGVQLEIPKHGACFQETYLSSYLGGRVVKTLWNKTGSLTLSEAELRSYFPRLANKVGQLRLVPIDRLKSPLGLPSEPSSFAYDQN